MVRRRSGEDAKPRCVAVTVTVGDGVHVESPLLSVLHGPTALHFAFALVPFLGSRAT